MSAAWIIDVRSPTIAAELRWMLGVTIGLALLAGACRRDAEAQIAHDPLGPIRCFEIAAERDLASTTAINLCIGATTVAPGECFALADDRGVLTEQQIVQLCRFATSNEPYACFDRLMAVGTLTNDQMIDFCATQCALGPPPAEAGNAECLAAALERADLAIQMAGELCTQALSAGPVDCFVTGENVSALTQSQLIQLCARTTSCQYVNAPPAAAY
jgi:hypothetical protein